MITTACRMTLVIVCIVCKDRSRGDTDQHEEFTQLLLDSVEKVKRNGFILMQFCHWLKFNPFLYLFCTQTLARKLNLRADVFARRELLGIFSACFDFLSNSLQCCLWAIQQSFIRFNHLLLFLQKRNNRFKMDERVKFVEKNCLGDLCLCSINVSKINIMVNDVVSYFSWNFPRWSKS